MILRKLQLSINLEQACKLQTLLQAKILKREVISLHTPIQKKHKHNLPKLTLKEFETLTWVHMQLKEKDLNSLGMKALSFRRLMIIPLGRSKTNCLLM